MKVRDLYYLDQMSALETNPAPAKHPERVLVIVRFEGALKPQIFKYRKVHDANSFYLYMKLWS